MENVPGMLDMVTPEGIPVVEAVAMDLKGWGDYDDIRRALGGRSTARAAVRKESPDATPAPAKKSGKSKKAASPEPACAQTLDLFGGTA
jgi:DNA (cytosine-5)-methyltransferase 1